MPLFRYIVDVDCYRNFDAPFTFSIADVHFESVSSEKLSAGPAGPWPFLIYTDVDAPNVEIALQLGRAKCTLAVDIAIFVSGYRMELGSEGARLVEPQDDETRVVQIRAGMAFRSDPASEVERQAFQTALASARLPDGGDISLQNALRWYAYALQDPILIDKFVKLFVALDMFVPRNAQGKNVPFAVRASRVFSPAFPDVDPGAIRSSIADLARVRNDLFHEGLAAPILRNATQILERIVRAIVRKGLSLKDEFDASDLFASLDRHIFVNEGGTLGWLGGSPTIELVTTSGRLRVGNAGAFDGKHYLYAGEAGVQIRTIFG